MQNLFPNLFRKASAALPGLMSADKWNNNGVTGLQLQVEHELPNVDIQFRNAIASTFDDLPEARDLALELLRFFWLPLGHTMLWMNIPEETSLSIHLCLQQSQGI